MKKTLIGARLLAAVACMTIPTAALAQECSRSTSSVFEYCECLYDDAKTRIMETQGTSTLSIKQRIEALGSAMKKCLGGATDEAATEMKKI